MNVYFEELIKVEKKDDLVEIRKKKLLDNPYYS